MELKEARYILAIARHQSIGTAMFKRPRWR